MLLKMDFPQLRCQAAKMIADLFKVTESFAVKRIELFENGRPESSFMRRGWQAFPKRANRRMLHALKK